MRKIEPSSAPTASTSSSRSVSRTTMPSRVAGSNILIVPCMTLLDRSDQAMRPEPTHRVGLRRIDISTALRLGDLAGLEAGRAHVDPLRRAVHDRAHPLHVRVPAPLRAPVRVAQLHAEDRLLAAHIAD